MEETFRAFCASRSPQLLLIEMTSSYVYFKILLCLLVFLWINLAYITGEKNPGSWNENHLRSSNKPLTESVVRHSVTFTVPSTIPMRFIEPTASTTNNSVKLVIVSSVGQNDMNHFIESMTTYRNTTVRFILNCFDTNDTCDQMEQSIRKAGLEKMVHASSRLSGAKIFFWKKILTPTVIDSFDYLWLIDADISFSYDLYPIAKLIGLAKAMNASTLHPTIPGPGGKMTKHHHHPHLPPIKPVCSLDILGSLYTRYAFSLLDTLGLQSIEDDVLIRSSWGIFGFVCDLLTVYPPQPTSFPCLQISIFPLLHFDSKTMPNREKRASVMPVWEHRRSELGLSGRCVGQLHLKEREITRLASSEQLSEITMVSLLPKQQEELQ